MDGLAFLKFCFFFGQQVFIVGSLLLVFGQEFFYLVFIEVFHHEDCVLLFFGFLELLLQDFDLV